MTEYRVEQLGNFPRFRLSYFRPASRFRAERWMPYRERHLDESGSYWVNWETHTRLKAEQKRVEVLEAEATQDAYDAQDWHVVSRR